MSKTAYVSIYHRQIIPSFIGKNKRRKYLWLLSQLCFFVSFSPFSVSLLSKSVSIISSVFFISLSLSFLLCLFLLGNTTMTRNKKIERNIRLIIFLITIWGIGKNCIPTVMIKSISGNISNSGSTLNSTTWKI